MTATPRERSACRWVQEHVETYVDGELEASLHAEFDRHLGLCGGCLDQVEFARAYRRHVRAAFDAPPAPEALRARVLAALERADRARRDGAPLEREGAWSRPLRVPAAASTVLALAGAAAIFAGYTRGDALPGTVGAPVVQAGLGGASLEDVVRVHQGVTPVVAGSAGLGRMLRAPELPRAELEESRVVALRSGSPAAAFRYRHAGAYVTLVVVEGDAFGRSRPATTVRLGDRPIQVVRVGGHAIPVFERNGMTFALTGDVDERELLRLASDAHVP